MSGNPFIHIIILSVQGYLDIAGSVFLQKIIPGIIQQKDAAMTRIEAATKPKPPVSPVKPAVSGDTPSKPPVKKVYKQLNRQVLFPPKTLEKPEDIDAYLAQVKATLTTMMQGCDGIRLN